MVWGLPGTIRGTRLSSSCWGGGGLVHCCLSANHHVTAFAALSQSKKWERGQIGQGPRVQPLTVTTVLLATDSDWQLVCPGKRWVQDRGS